jgi:NADH dehydrogenase
LLIVHPPSRTVVNGNCLRAGGRLALKDNETMTQGRAEARGEAAMALARRLRRGEDDRIAVAKRVRSASMPVPLVTIFGGSGFLGRRIAQRMANAGWRVRVAVRRPNEAGFVRPYGFVGQVEPVQANVRDEVSTRRAIVGADAVINCVAIMGESGKQTFSAIVDEGAVRIARIATEEGVGRLVQISALGADLDSPSAYAHAKAKAEAGVRAEFPGAVILRPSIMFGDGDGFFNRFAAMARMTPVMPLIGPETRFQPVSVDDVAAAAAKAATETVPAGIYELGGPEVESFRGLIERILAIVRRRRLLVTVPWGAARVLAGVLDRLQRWTGGLVSNSILTRDQLKLLQADNVVDPQARGFADLGITPIAMEAVLESYLYAYRPNGQYAEIQESAARMRS